RIQGRGRGDAPRKGRNAGRTRRKVQALGLPYGRVEERPVEQLPARAHHDVAIAERPESFVQQLPEERDVRGPCDGNVDALAPEPVELRAAAIQVTRGTRPPEHR